MVTVAVDVMEELLESIREYNDSRYDLDSSIEEANETLKQEMNRNKLSYCHFSENEWYLEISLEAVRISIDFNEIKEAIQFNKDINSMEFVQLAKCWTASLIEEGYSTEIIERMVKELKEFLILTKGLTITNEDELVDKLAKLPERRLSNICNSLLNFFDYSPNLGDELVSILYSIKPTYKEGKARLLPPSKDILIFSKVLENYFTEQISEWEYRKWFPVWLWWNLTTLIPIRPSEFCTIERDCLIQKKTNFYIKLPRHKQKLNNKRNIQVLDEINIPEKLYRKIEEYKQKTESFGQTVTLISYRSLPSIISGKYVENAYVTQKVNPDKFTINPFRDILNSFYEHIVFGENNVVLCESESQSDGLSITRQLRPGDTRHLAFINLNRQGYHPVEIARIGGHVTLQTQNHYFNHIQNFVDLEILELITNIDLDSYKNKMSDSESRLDRAISMSFIDKYVLRPAFTDFKMEMIDGYCTDPHQRCKVEDCWECDSWRISEEEFIKKKDILARKLTDSKSEINEVIENLKYLYNSIYANGKDDFYSSDNPEMRKELINKSKRIDNAVRKYVNLSKISERIDSTGNKG